MSHGSLRIEAQILCHTGRLQGVNPLYNYFDMLLHKELKKKGKRHKHLHVFILGYINRPEDKSTHNIEFEQWGLGTIWLDGEGLNCALEAQCNSTRLEGKQWNLSGINLQIHQQTWKHLGKLQREKNGKHGILWYFGNFKNMFSWAVRSEVGQENCEGREDRENKTLWCMINALQC